MDKYEKEEKKLLDDIEIYEQKLLSSLLGGVPKDFKVLEVRKPLNIPYVIGRDNGRIEVVIRAVVGRKPNKKDFIDIENDDWIKEDNRDY